MLFPLHFSTKQRERALGLIVSVRITQRGTFVDVEKTPPGLDSRNALGISRNNRAVYDCRV